MQTSRGITLIELCFGMAIVAVLAGMAAPGFRMSLRAAAVRSATFELVAGLQQARGNSIVESRPGILCPSDAAGACLPAGMPSSHWQWSVEPAAGPAPAHAEALPAGVTLRATRSPIRFWPDALGATNGTLTICDLRGVAPPRAIVVSVSGRPRTAFAPDSACRS
jgi:type IV fimbrial biogenesis protein FimT